MDLLGSCYDMEEAKVPFTFFFYFFLLRNGTDGCAHPMGGDMVGKSLSDTHARRGGYTLYNTGIKRFIRCSFYTKNKHF